MNCIFFGHHDAPSEIKASIKRAIFLLYQKEHIQNYYVGNNGKFDYYVQCILKEMINDGIDICFNIVLSNLNETALSGYQYDTVFPEGLENTPKRFAIAKRNDWLIRNGSFLIAYVKNPFSNSKKWFEKALKRGIQVINLAEENQDEHFLF